MESQRRATTRTAVVRRVVLRGAGLSFDGQSVDDDLAVSLEHLDALSVDPTNTLQSGFLRRCLPSVFGGVR